MRETAHNTPGRQAGIRPAGATQEGESLGMTEVDTMTVTERIEAEMRNRGWTEDEIEGCRHVDGRLSQRAQQQIDPSSLVVKKIDERGIESWWLERKRTEWREHDGIQDWQVCRDCDLRIGSGRTTEYDDAYHSEDHDPAECPSCGGPMGLDEEVTERTGLGRHYGEADRALRAIIQSSAAE